MPPLRYAGSVEPVRPAVLAFVLTSALSLGACADPPSSGPIGESTAPSAPSAPGSSGDPSPTGDATPSTAPRAPEGRTARTFRATVRPVTRADVRYSYAPGCPVAPRQLRKLRVSYWGFDGDVHRGTLIVAHWAVAPVRAAFRGAFRDRFKVRKIRPVERYYRGSRAGMAKSDARSMRADNTSAFNCRYATGSSRFSAHSWGDAVEVNPRENPHVLGGRTYPPNGARFADRGRKHKGMLRAGSAMTKVMRKRGWTWGGTYRSPDYQHFSRTGR